LSGKITVEITDQGDDIRLIVPKAAVLKKDKAEARERPEPPGEEE
jgi:hypothetical protein